MSEESELRKKNRLQVRELYDKYKQATQGCGNDIRAIRIAAEDCFDKHIRLKDVGAEEMIVRVRGIEKACIQHIQSYEYSNYTNRHFVFALQKINLFTNLVSGSGSNISADDYDYLIEMDVLSYIRKRMPNAVNTMDEMLKNETETTRRRRLLSYMEAGHVLINR